MGPPAGVRCGGCSRAGVRTPEPHPTSDAGTPPAKAAELLLDAAAAALCCCAAAAAPPLSPRVKWSAPALLPQLRPLPFRSPQARALSSGRPEQLASHAQGTLISRAQTSTTRLAFLPHPRPASRSLLSAPRPARLNSSPRPASAAPFHASRLLRPWPARLSSSESAPDSSRSCSRASSIAAPPPPPPSPLCAFPLRLTR